MRETLIYPLSAGFIYRIMYGGGLYSGKAMNAAGWEMAKTAAEVCNSSYELGRDNGRAGMNRQREYMRKMKKAMKAADGEKQCRRLYKPLMGLAEMGYRDGFRKGKQEMEGA